MNRRIVEDVAKIRMDQAKVKALDNQVLIAKSANGEIVFEYIDPKNLRYDNNYTIGEKIKSLEEENKKMRNALVKAISAFAGGVK